MKASCKHIWLGTAVIAGLTLGSTTIALAIDANSNAGATITPALGISNSKSLNFTSIVPSGTADTVKVSASGLRTCGATLTCTGIVQTSVFDVVGGANLAYAITLPTSDATLISGANSMTVDSFSDSASGNGTLDNAGVHSFAVGATLNVGANQPAGDYIGTFTVTIEYN